MTQMTFLRICLGIISACCLGLAIINHKMVHLNKECLQMNEELLKPMKRTIVELPQGGPHVE